MFRDRIQNRSLLTLMYSTWTCPVKWSRSRTAPESARKENSAATSRSFRSSFAKAIAFTALSRASAVNRRIFRIFFSF